MGLENRDYLRDEARRYGEGPGGGFGAQMGADAPACKRIIIFTVIVFVAQMIFTRAYSPEEKRDIVNARSFEVAQQIKTTGDPDGKLAQRLTRLQNGTATAKDLVLPPNHSYFEEYFALRRDHVLSGQVWRLFTMAFLHSRSSPLHIAFNMLIVWFIGKHVESRLGTREFYVFYFVACIASSLAYLAFGLLMDRSATCMGASGAAMALMMLFTMPNPRQQMLLFMVIPMQMRWIMLGLIAMDAFPVLMQLAGRPYDTNIAHEAHLGGVLFGFWYFKSGMKLERFLEGPLRWWKHRQSGLRVVRADDDFESPPVKTKQATADIDGILKKISEQGEESLTRAERKTLEKASRELRNRRDP